MEQSSLTLVEAARALGVRTATLRAQIARGRLRGIRRGRDWHVSGQELTRYRDDVQGARPTRASGLEQILRVIAGQFEQTGTWPTASSLQRALVLRGLELDVDDMSRRLDPSLGRVERGGVAVLTIRGLRRAGANESVADFERAMRLAIARYRIPEIGEPAIASTDFADVGELRIKRLREMLVANPLLTGGGGGTPPDWSYRVSDDIHRLGRVRTVGGYLTAIDQLTAPRGLLDIGPAAFDWPELEGRIRELSSFLERAQTVDDYRDIGRRSREIISALADMSIASVEPDHRYGSDRKAKLDAYLDRVVGGESLSDLRGMVRIAYKLANHTTHDPDPLRAEAVAAAQAAVLLVRTFNVIRQRT